MTLINALISRFLSEEEGQGLAEYALILALIAIVAIVALIFLGGQVSTTLSASATRSSADLFVSHVDAGCRSRQPASILRAVPPHRGDHRVGCPTRACGRYRKTQHPGAKREVRDGRYRWNPGPGSCPQGR